MLGTMAPLARLSQGTEDRVAKSVASFAVVEGTYCPWRRLDPFGHLEPSSTDTDMAQSCIEQQLLEPIALLVV